MFFEQNVACFFSWEMLHVFWDEKKCCMFFGDEKVAAFFFRFQLFWEENVACFLRNLACFWEMLHDFLRSGKCCMFLEKCCMFFGEKNVAWKFSSVACCMVENSIWMDHHAASQQPRSSQPVTSQQPSSSQRVASQQPASIRQLASNQHSGPFKWSLRPMHRTNIFM